MQIANKLIDLSWKYVLKSSLHYKFLHYHHLEPFSLGKSPDCLTLPSVVQPQFTPSAFWCGCSVCSPAPAVCSLPFNNLPLAKSLTLARAALFAFYTRRWETCRLIHASALAAKCILQKSGVTSHLHSNSAWARHKHSCVVTTNSTRSWKSETCSSQSDFTIIDCIWVMSICLSKSEIKSKLWTFPFSDFSV